MIDQQKSQATITGDDHWRPSMATIIGDLVAENKRFFRKLRSLRALVGHQPTRQQKGQNRTSVVLQAANKSMGDTTSYGNIMLYVIVVVVGQDF